MSAGPLFRKSRTISVVILSGNDFLSFKNFQKVLTFLRKNPEEVVFGFKMANFQNSVTCPFFIRTFPILSFLSLLGRGKNEMKRRQSTLRMRSWVKRFWENLNIYGTHVIDVTAVSGVAVVTAVSAITGDSGVSAFTAVGVWLLSVLSVLS